MNKKVLLLIIALILLAGKALALGVSPGKINIDFKPNLEREIELTVINNEQKELDVAINTEGELNQYITFDKKDVHLSPSEGSKTIKYKIKLPEKIERPGMHEANVIIREAKSVTGEGIRIGAALAVISILNVRVPYEGKYAEAELFIDAEKEDETTFIVGITNYGAEDIEKAQATIGIFYDNKKIDTVTTDEKSVNKGNRKELIAKWTPKKQGFYKAKAKINYDGKTIERETEFKTGGLFIKIIDIAVKNFKLGGIAKFQILLDNLANKKSEEVYTKLMLNDAEGRKLMGIESQRAEMLPQERKEVQAYWDTGGVEKGGYNGKVELHADGEKWETPMSMDVQEDKITTRIGPTAMAVTDTGTEYKESSLITVLVIIMILMNIAWFVYYKKRKKK